MNEENGLPTLEDKSIDLCLTDPPWGIDYNKGGNKGFLRKYVNGRVLRPKANVTHYEDKFRPEWFLSWFNELIRICNQIIVVIGQKNLNWWYKNTDPKGMLCIYHKNAYSGNSISKWNKFTPYLVFGKVKNKNRIFSNVIEYVIPWGFLSKDKWIHPSPKGTEIAYKILNDLKPESLIDPFLGSGSYAQAATQLGIPWIGYEINEVYSQDINKRLKNCKKEPVQTILI